MSRNRIRPTRGSRLAAGVAAATTALLATALTPTAGAVTPTAGAAERPSRATAIADAATALAHEAARLGLTSAEGTGVRDVVIDADGGRHVRYDRPNRRPAGLGGAIGIQSAPARSEPRAG
ncbi:peptidase M4 family protein, partial [Streptomyces sp. NPDC059466]